VPPDERADDISAHIGKLRHGQKIDQEKAVLFRIARHEGQQRHEVEEKRHIEQPQQGERRGGDRRAVRLRHHDEPDERAEQGEDENEFLAEMDEARVARVVDEKIPRIGENERAAEKAALLENLVPFFLLGAIELPLSGQPEKGDEQLSEGTLELLSKVDMGHAGRNFALPPEASKEHSRRAM
jgi:hypothetical protein